ncbi:MAG TPA: subclass B3 metallo-beta-lactamase [Thermoanaerobaculia bacterium]|nr:subclass B3 metallo-beta-lactamase [Thermoanaerobaculia bacterium]
MAMLAEPPLYLPIGEADRGRHGRHGHRHGAGGLLPAVMLGIAALLAPSCLESQADPTARAMNQPVAPFRILGNLHSVGASDITSFLLATNRGLILLDGGFVETAPQIRDNIARLGFKPSDVKIVLNSHAHYDHAGGLAQLKAWTGARLFASPGDTPLLEAGGRGDPLFGDTLPFPPVKVDHLLRDGEAVTLGDTTLVAHLTPGHTRGCTTWTTRVAEGGRLYDVVFVCSTSVLPGYRLVGHPTYPGIADDYARTFATLAALPCDVFLGSHASFYGGSGKARRLLEGAEPNPFVDPQGYRAYLARAEAAFREQLAREHAPAPGKRR